MKKTVIILLLTGLVVLLACSTVSGRRAGKRDYCQLSPERGRCKAARQKWYYDSSTGECRDFTWGGCGGNANKFATKTFCERVCKPAGCRYESCNNTCPNGFIINAEGCNTCRCQPGPEQASCPAIDCPSRCPHGYLTGSDGCMTCDCRTEQVQPRVSRTTIQHKCPPVCYMYCQYGNKKDEQGCDICACKSKEEACGSEQCLMECPIGFVTDNRGCELCECKPAQGNGTSCPPNHCFKECSLGFQKDSFGCDMCICATRTSSRRDKIRQTSDCSKRPMCFLHCSYGFLKGRDGCDICKCAGRNTDRRQARIERRHGNVSSSEDLCGVRPMCAMFCPDGFQQDSKGCDLCACQDQPPHAAQLPALIPAHIPAQQPGEAPVQIPAQNPAQPSSKAGCSPKRCHKRTSCAFGFAQDRDGCDTCVCSNTRSRSNSKRPASQ